MAVKWTSEQQQVIEARDCNILVSAAAGSGKTAVLVERIINKIMDTEHPVNIDQFVIVTFTNAAAGEMRDRIQSAIEKQASLYPDNAHLQRQRTRIHMANISTIHSFCTNIIRNHFQEIDLDPAFRVGDDGELKLMRKDVLSQVLEGYYEEGREEFYGFTETFASGKSDDTIEDIILELYNYAMSFPYPEQWLKQCQEVYEVNTSERLMETEWMQFLYVHVDKLLEYISVKTEKLFQLVMENPEAINYREIAEYYRGIVSRFCNEKDYNARREFLKGIIHPKLPVGKKACQDVVLREEIKGVRADVKDTWEKLCADYFSQSLEQILEDIANCRPVMTMLIDVTRHFMECYKAEKRQKNLLDYNDLEHEALKILLDVDGNPTATALEYAGYFEEILIDEYQDSNLVQEYLLNAVSKQSMGEHNLFMVGDAKQSIYRFRLARPELFMEKFDSYSTEDGKCRRIDLHKNFRSRIEVLDSANYIFEKIMKKSLGEIEYDEGAALYQGMEFPKPQTPRSYATEILLLDEKKLEADKMEAEAKVIAHRIKELVSEETGLSVVDKQTGQYRKACYSDMAILLRSSGLDTVLAEVLAAEGIPAHMVSTEGYFNALEIVTILNYLRIIDNPFQDIPLLAVLKSPIAGITDEELAVLRVFHGEDCLCQCVQAYAKEGEEETLRSKLSEFLEQLEQFRQKMYYMAVPEFICHILEVTGYGDYIAVMPGGTQRKANMDMLIDKALAFEQTSYTGVFQFIRYIEQLQKYKVDMGEASILNENDNTVRIMTIHKSKGLEFPIVFVAGLGKEFNRQDEKKPLALHGSMGIGMDSIYLDSRIKRKTLLRKSIVLKNRLETLGEELRVLYVALTRAKEKLILSGCAENLETAVTNAYKEAYQTAPAYGALIRANTYLNWILMAVIGHESMKDVAGTYVDEPGSVTEKSTYKQADFIVKEITLQEIMEEDLTEMAQEARVDMELEQQLKKRDIPLPEEIREALEYVYPYEDKAIPVKVSVSELKHAGMILDEEDQQLIENKERAPIYPSFLKEKEQKVSGSDRGTAYHKVFQYLNLERADDVEQIKEQLDEMYTSGILKEVMRHVVKPEKLYTFAHSAIGLRMKRAQKDGRLYMEQPFVFAMPARKLNESWDSDEPVMIQGIIDVFFEEEGQLVLLDYKTDYVKSGQPKELVDKYKVQMEYYKAALEAITEKKVKETVLYSVYLDKEIFC